MNHRSCTHAMTHLYLLVLVRLLRQTITTTYTETTLNLGPHLVAFRRQTVILPATTIRRRVVPLSMVVKQMEHAAVYWRLL